MSLNGIIVQSGRLLTPHITSYAAFSIRTAFNQVDRISNIDNRVPGSIARGRLKRPVTQTNVAVISEFNHNMGNRRGEIISKCGYAKGIRQRFIGSSPLPEPGRP
jgi:hypothetical protein